MRVMSVTKSVVGCVTAALVDRDLLDTDRPVTDFVPELADSGYAGATVRNILDMRSGVRFREDYTDPDADVVADRRVARQASTATWPGWMPRRRTASGSSTARRRPTCWAGCANASPAGRWPS